MAQELLQELPCKTGWLYLDILSKRLLPLLLSELLASMAFFPAVNIFSFSFVFTRRFFTSLSVFVPLFTKYPFLSSYNTNSTSRLSAITEKK